MATPTPHSPSALVSFTACVHRTELERARQAGLVKKPHFAVDPSLAALIARGREHEQAHLRSLRARGLEVTEIPVEDLRSPAAVAEAARQTEVAMRAGVAVIYQATFLAEGWRGHADFLHRVEEPSALGVFSYEPWDTKLARDAHASALLQLCAYGDLIAKIQGRLPENVHVVLGGPGTPIESYRLAALAPYFRQVRAQFLQQMAGSVAPAFPVTEPYPDPCAHCEVCDWATVCEKRWRDDDYVALVAGITRNQRVSLRERGITSLAALAELTLPLTPPLDRTSPVSVERIREQARVQRLGRERKAPVHELVPAPGEGKGLEALPEPSPGDLFFDIEGDPFVGSEGREYLFGVIEPSSQDPDRTAGTPAYHELWGLDAAGERRAFEGLVDLIVARRAQDPRLHVYHYAPYEPSAMKRLAARLGTRVEAVDDLLRGGVFVDLYRVVRQGVRASVESYSIKKLEPFYGFTREVDLRVSGDARATLEVWLESGGTTPLVGHDEIVHKVRLYNRDDCLSVWKLRGWLETLRAEASRALGAELPRRTPPVTESSAEAIAARAEIEALKGRLCRDVPPERSARSPEQQARWLLAQLIEWHWREAKSTWWEYFRLRDLDPQELLEDPKPIGGLTYEGVVGTEKKSKIHRYRFPAQEHDLRAGSGCRELYTEEEWTVHALDNVACTLDMKRGEKSPAPNLSALAPFENVRTDAQVANLRELAEWAAEHGIEGPGPCFAVRDLLLCRPPAVGQAVDTPLAVPGEDTGDAAVRLVLALARSERGGVLPIQGPPGAGKTYTGARMVLALVQAGFKVGITANGHAVVGKLLEDVCTLARKTGASVAIVQKPKEGGAGAVQDSYVTVATGNPAVAKRLADGSASVAAGTHWLFAAADMKDAVDVLFVDEAGQMSLANAVAIGPSTRCLVLLGDPQQLDQPTKGVHPEGAGASALEHLLAESLTMPAHRGLFLEKTWRLNPALCAFTSEMFYEGRLSPRPGLERQELRASAPFGGAGLRWCGVEHAGNTNESSEEVTCIKGVVEALLVAGTKWIDAAGKERSIAVTDVLVVAPYNAQVRALVAALPPDARVGTVDKFQGQEAPVVIYSMTTSTPEDAPRGMDFLYSLNRLNVATSRARCVAIVVGSPALLRPACRTPRQMMQAAALCRVAELGGTGVS
jgi:uncharacterized protein